MRRVRWYQRTAITSIALGCLLAVTTGIVHAQAGRSSGAQAVGEASAIAVAGEEQQTVACKLSVPPHALTAEGLATPWVLSGDHGGKCTETVADQAAFIDATIFDPATGKVSIYRPLIVTQGTTAAADPVAPTLPDGAIVEIGVGFNGDELTLTDAHEGRDIAAAQCVNGLGDSIFGQEIFCNARAFYSAANGKVTFTPPRASSPDDGHLCPTTESWEIVDQDQSDNTTTSYLVRGDQTAQDTAANRRELGGDLIANGSDNALYSKFYGPAIHCQPPRAPDLTDPSAPVQSTSSALLNLYARAAGDPEPALVPLGDPFTMVDGAPSLRKTNLYRAQVDQPPAPRAEDASTATYCHHLLDLGLPKIELDKPFLQALGRSPDSAVSDDLHLFILNRFKESWDNLGCETATGIPNPVTITTDADGRVLSAAVTSAAAAATTTATTTRATTTRATTTTASTTTATTAGPSTTVAASGTVAPSTTVAASGTVAPSTTVAASTAAAPSTTVAPSTTANQQSAPAAVPGLAEPAQRSSIADPVVLSNARPAGALPFTGLDSGVLLLAAALLMLAGGWLLVRAGRLKRSRRAW